MAKVNFCFIFIYFLFKIEIAVSQNNNNKDRTRVIVTTDGEIDDECSLVRFLLYANEWDIEGIITSSSQYHWHGHNWAGDDWIEPSLDAYSEVYQNLLQHDSNYPSPQYLAERTFLGNVEAEGEMENITDGSQHIVKVLLDESDNRPIWLQAWGGTNTIARALKTIEEEHPEKMQYVANKVRFFFIWEQDKTYQEYIRPHWAKYQIMTIISDQFESIAYRWKLAQPEKMHQYYKAAWMKENILKDHGPLTASYKSHTGDKEGFVEGDFRSEGDSPAFMHTIVTGLGNLDNPDWGGWGGRYVKVRENTWLDPVPDKSYKYPEGRWYGSNGWGRSSLRPGSEVSEEDRKVYFKPIWLWSEDFQNDFAARADWCTKSFGNANHAPIVSLKNALQIEAKVGKKVRLKIKGVSDPDGDKLNFKWWKYEEPSSYKGSIEIKDSNKGTASFIMPQGAQKNENVHVICEVTDNGIPNLTRYQRIIITIK